MANIFEQYGLKEVANVTFYALKADPKRNIVAGQPVLFLDTLKVSNIETTAEDTAAQGGWGNPKLITWEYGKEVNLTLEDALFSPASLQVMMGAGLVESKAATSGEGAQPAVKVDVQINEEIELAASTGIGTLSHAAKGDVYALIEGTYVKLTVDTDDKTKVTLTSAGTGMITARVFYTTEVAEDNKAMQINITAKDFGGTYKIVGDTLVRDRDGHDTPFQFVVEKAKINADVTFEMSADGDPATFSMPITAMKADDGTMFKLVKYNLDEAE